LTRAQTIDFGRINAARTRGSMTPPVGVAMYTVCGMLKCPMDEYTREAIPHIAAVLVLVVLMIYVPQIVPVLPRLVL
jgi:TRAP-type transport system large permease protein